MNVVANSTLNDTNQPPIFSANITNENQTFNNSTNQTLTNNTINETIPINESLVLNQTQNETEQTNQTQQPSLIKTILNLIVDKYSVIKGEIINIKSYLAYENETPIPNKQIDFYADNLSIGTENTDNSGLAEINWNTSDVYSGNYTIKAEYAGDDTFNSVNSSVEINLSEEVVNETVPDNETVLNVDVVNAGQSGAAVPVITIELTEQGNDYNITPRRLKFEFDGKLYAIQVRRVKQEYVNFLVMTLDMNKPNDITAYTLDESFSLISGEKKEIDIDKDGVMDIAIELKNIDSPFSINGDRIRRGIRQADIFIRRI